MFSRGIVVPLLIALVAIGGCGSSKTVATVNGHDISEADFHSELMSLENQGMKALSFMITYQLLMDELERKHIKIADAELDAQIRQSYGPDWQRQVIQAGKTVEDQRRETRSQLAMHKLMTDGVKVSDADTRKLYETNSKSFTLVQFARIVLRNKEEAEAVAKRLGEGGQFAELAKERSLDPPQIRENGGVIGPPTSIANCDGHYLQAVDKLPVGTPSPPFSHLHQGNDTPLWEIVKIVKQEQMKFEQVKDNLRDEVLRAKAMEQGRNPQALIAELASKAKVIVKEPRLMALEQQYKAGMTPGARGAPDKEDRGKSSGKSKAKAASESKSIPAQGGKGG